MKPDPVTLAEYLNSLPAASEGDAEPNLVLLEARLDAGAELLHAAALDLAFGPFRDGCVMVALLLADGTTETLPVGLGPRTRARLSAAGDVPVTRGPGLRAQGSVPPPPPSRDVSRELRERFAATADLPPEERARRLMQWLLERLDAARCALVPCEDGRPGEPLAFLARGAGQALADPRRLPTRVLEHVARTRQPLVSDDAAAPGGVVEPTSTIERQGIRSFVAVPIVLSGELLAIAYVDRLDGPAPFSPDEQLGIEALGFDLALPALELREARRRRELVAVRDAVLARDVVADAVSPSPALAPVLERAMALAPLADTHLLLLGETGVGKEWIARLVHDRSGRRGPFVAVNVSAIPGELFESELMGSARGGFSGAVDRIGRVGQAEGGTLFLDEIGDLDLKNQVGLLRFLQERTVRPVGSTTERVADVRIIAATNRLVHEMAAQGSFREDLLHRFAPPLVIPPLRERGSEILPLAMVGLRLAARKLGIAPPQLSDDAKLLLRASRWPGNVRQLQKVLDDALAVTRAAVLGAADIERALAQAAPQAVQSPDAGPATWSEFEARATGAERDWLASKLARHGGNVQATARAIDCPPTTLRHLLTRHGLITPKA